MILNQLFQFYLKQFAKIETTIRAHFSPIVQYCFLQNVIKYGWSYPHRSEFSICILRFWFLCKSPSAN